MNMSQEVTRSFNYKEPNPLTKHRYSEIRSWTWSIMIQNRYRRRATLSHWLIRPGSFITTQIPCAACVQFYSPWQVHRESKTCSSSPDVFNTLTVTLCNSGCHLWLSRWPSSLKVKVKLPCMLSNFGFLFNSWLDNTWSPLTYIYWKRCSFLLLLCFCHFTFNFVLILFSVLGTLVKGI